MLPWIPTWESTQSRAERQGNRWNYSKSVYQTWWELRELDSPYRVTRRTISTVHMVFSDKITGLSAKQHLKTLGIGYTPQFFPLDTAFLSDIVDVVHEVLSCLTSFFSTNPCSTHTLPSNWLSHSSAVRPSYSVTCCLTFHLSSLPTHHVEEVCLPLLWV